MALVRQIRKKLQEANIYRKQGLLIEAKEKYINAAELLQKNEQLENSQNLIKAIFKKVSALENEISNVRKKTKSPEISTRAQNLIKNLFSFSKDNDKDVAALEGAIALAKFGQFERALKEFEILIDNDSLRVVAAKNILRCHVAISSLDDAVSQFNQWMTDDLFSFEQLKKIRLFLKDIIEKRGADIGLPQIQKDETESEKIDDQEIFDISSIGITFDKGPRKGDMVEFDVSFQSGNMISLIISSKDKEWIDSLNVGLKLNNIQFYSPTAMSSGSGIVASKTQIKSGPKQGDYCLGIKITDA